MSSLLLVIYKWQKIRVVRKKLKIKKSYIAIAQNFYKWRRVRDSNSRRALTLNGFQDRRNQPLYQLSALEINATGKYKCQDFFAIFFK